MPRPNSQDHEDTTLPWAELYGPQSVLELAVHPRKVNDVRTCLQGMFALRAVKKILVLSGPAGCGKSTTCRLLCRENRWQVVEWRLDSGMTRSSFGPESSSFPSHDSLSRQAQYQGLVLKGLPGGSRPSSRLNSGKKAGERIVILVEEAPTSIRRDSKSLVNFRQAIVQHLAESRDVHLSPVVLIVTNTQLAECSTEAMSAYRLLGPDLLNHPNVAHIVFNPVAPTFMVKALDRVVEKHSQKSCKEWLPSREKVKDLSLVGDLRSAFFALEFAASSSSIVRAAARTLPRKHFQTASRAKKKGSITKAVSESGEEEKAAADYLRASSLGLFHAVGKVVYNKREEKTDQTLPQPSKFFGHHARSKGSLVDIDALVAESGTELDLFIAAIHENYMLSCEKSMSEETCRCVEDCANFLSDGDLLLSRHNSLGQSNTPFGLLRAHEMAFNVVVRGLLFTLPSPVRRATASAGHAGRSANQAAHKMYFPTSARMWRMEEETRDSQQLLLSRLFPTIIGFDERFEGEAGKKQGIELWNTRPKLYSPCHPNLQFSRGCATSMSEASLLQLPYIFLVAIARRCSAVQSHITARDIEMLRQVVTFTGIGGPLESDDGIETLNQYGESRVRRGSCELPVGPSGSLKCSEGESELMFLLDDPIEMSDDG